MITFQEEGVDGIAALAAWYNQKNNLLRGNVYEFFITINK